MKIFFLLCLAVICQLISGLPVYADGSVGGSFQVGDDTIPAPDITPPTTVSTLSVVGVAPYSIKLKWIAPGDNGNIGTATRYDIRFSLSPITNEAEWADSNLVYAVSKPKAPGTTELFTVNGLLPLTTYYLALKTADEVFNWSGISNCVKATTSVAYVEWEEDDEDEQIDDDIIPTPIPDDTPIYFDIKGKKGVVYLNLQADGSLAQTWIITLDNGLLEMVLPKGTIFLDNAGDPISVIVLKCVEPFGEAPAGFEFDSIYEFQPTCTIKPPVSIKMRYNREYLNEGVNEADIYIANYSQSQVRWVPLPSVFDIDNQAVSTNLNHFSLFCLLVPKSEITPLPLDDTISHLNVTNLTLSSNIIAQGENLIVNVDIVNDSDIAGDFYLPIYVNGVILDSKTIRLEARQVKSETFTIVLDEEGTQAIGVGSMSTSVTVKKSEASAISDYLWLRIPLSVLIIAGLVIILVINNKRRRKKDKTLPQRF